MYVISVKKSQRYVEGFYAFLKISDDNSNKTNMGECDELPNDKVHPSEVECHKESALLKVHYSECYRDISSFISH